MQLASGLIFAVILPAMNNKSSAKSSRGKTILISLVIAVLIAIGLFVAGFVKGRAQTTNLNTQISSLQNQLSQAQTQLADSQNNGFLLRARAALYHTAIDLDERNFGTANDRLIEAADALGKVTQGSGNIDTNAIAKLRSSISAMNINVAVNLEDQRTQVLNFASQLSSLMGDKTPAHS